MRFEYWKSAIDQQWYWHLKISANQKLAQGESAATKEACLQAIEQVREAREAAIESLTPDSDGAAGTRVRQQP